ncbi:DNA translocase FtsK [Candidatus Shapirobacteria bacterium]|nr:DNA translocase FtsK [Candidatus Shapirobacteria bacterium]
MPRYRRNWFRRSLKLNRIRLKKATVFSVASLILIAFGILVIISFSQQGSLLIKLNLILTRLFGFGIFLLPFLLLVAGLMLTRFRTPINQPNVLVGGILLFICALGLAKSGIVGEEIWAEIAILISPFGAFLILAGGTLIGLLVLFNTSFDQIISLIFKFIVSCKNLLISARAPKPKFAQNKTPLKLEEEPQTSKPEKPPLKGPEELAPVLVSNLPGAKPTVWQYPPLSLLSDGFGGKADRGDLKGNAAIIEKTLDSFGISARVVEVNLGPAVTQYAIEVALGTKLSKITALANDLALALAAPTGQIRIEAPIPGRSLVGLELPNRSLEFVTLKQMLESEAMKQSKSKLTVALGLDVSGNPKVADIAKMPHVLIAGQTGSGKSVLLNSWIANFLFRTTPNEVKLILVDPKRVELTQYNGLPHLLTPVIVEVGKVVSALKWAMSEMDRRYKLFAQVGARNIDTYNEISGFQALPYIVIIIDELADIILFAPAEVEDSICRIAQMSRATGIHLIISTQRPSVDVLTGLIKANIPCRISFAVSSMIDSRVIVDTPGAEKLLGRGDMLYIPPGQAKPSRIQGAYVSEPEIQRLIEFLRKSGVTPAYTEEVVEMPVRSGKAIIAGTGEEKDDLFDEALRIVCQYDRASASLLQRRLSIGYARAARILDQLEAAGIVGPGEGAKPREVLIKNADEFLRQAETQNPIG